ncbi:reverse transcriptase endonuclease [Trypanosoma cruzi]|nr:reverse transcriptase endonuclease [Trypanosoma cruzi]
METTKDGEGSVGDEKKQQDPTAHQTEQILTASDIYKARRAETLCTLQATGRAAALLTAAEAEPVAFSPELVQSLDDLYPQLCIQSPPSVHPWSRSTARTWPR